MRRLVKSGLTRKTCYLVALLLLLQVGAVPLLGAAAPPSGPNVLVFDLTNTAGAGGTEIADRITLELKAKLHGAGAALMYYDPHSPALQRAIAEGTLTKEDLALPMDKDRALLIAERLGADLAVVGTVDKYSWDEKTGQLTIDVNATVIDVASKTPRVVVFSAKSPTKMKEISAIPAATNEAAYLLAKAVVGERALSAAATRPYGPGASAASTNGKKSSKKSQNLLLALLLAGAIAAAAGGGGGGGGGGGTTPSADIINPVAEPTADAVVLTWECTRGGVTGFNIYRAPAGLAASPAVSRFRGVLVPREVGGKNPKTPRPLLQAPRRMSASTATWTKLAQVGPGTLTYTDSANSPNGPRFNTLYQYEIRAVLGSEESGGAVARNRYNNALTVAPGQLSPPTNLQFAAGPTQLSTYVSWVAPPQPYVENYRIYRAGVQAGPYQVLGQVAGNTLRFLDSQGLVAGNTYWYKVVASTAAGRSEASSEPVAYQMRAGVLSPPSNLVVYPSATKITLAWQASPDPAATGYYVYRNNARLGGDYLQTTADDTTAVSGVSYTYKVTAHNAAGQESAPTNSVTTSLRPPPANITLSAAPISINGDGVTTSTLTARVTDSGGTPVPDTGVTFSATAPGRLVDASGNPVTGNLLVSTNSSGIATARVRSDTAVTADTQTTVTATCTTLRANVTVSLLVPKPGSISVTVVPDSIPGNGTSTASVNAIVRDLDSQPLPGAVVTISTTDGTLRVKAGTDGRLEGGNLIVTSGAGGLATCDLVAPVVSAQETATVTVSVVGPSGTHTATDAVTFTVPTVEGVTVVAERTSLPGDGVSSTPVTATVRDRDGQPMAGKTVTFSVDQPGVATISPASGVTNAQGQVVATLTSAADNSYGTVIITATSEGKQGTTTVQFSPPQMISVAINPAVLPAGGTNIEALITATCRYVTNLPVPGAKVMFGFESPGGFVATSPTGAAIKVTTASTTDANGLAYNYVISAPTLANGDYDIVVAWIDKNEDGAYTSGEPVARVRVNYTAPPASVTIAASPTRLPGNGAATSLITAAVYTDIPNPNDPGRFIPVGDGVPVVLTTGQGTFAETDTNTCTVRTVSGTVQALLVSAQVATETTTVVTATACTCSQSVSVTFYPAASGPTLELAAIPSVLSANGTSSAVITASLRDGSGVAMVGKTVTFTTNLGTLNAGSAVTDATGRASVTLTAGLTAGTACVTARAEGVDNNVLVPIRTGVPKNIYVSPLLPSIIAATNGQPSPVDVPVRTTIKAVVTDESGYPVPNVDVHFSTDIGVITPNVTTDGDGEAFATLTACDFLTASDPSRAHAGRGIASVQVSAGEAVWPNPVNYVFAGECDLYRWDGMRNGTDIYTPQGATFDQPGGNFTQQPNVVPVAGSKLHVYAVLHDSNDNPLPYGTPVVFHYNPGNSTRADSPTQRAYMRGGDTVADYEFDISQIGNKDSAYPATVSVSVQGIIAGTTLTFGTTQWIGADRPATVAFLGSADRGQGRESVTVNVRDRFDNRVQDYNLINWRVSGPPTNTVVTFPDGVVTPTQGGTATNTVEAHLIDPTQGGNFTIRAYWNETVYAEMTYNIAPPAAAPVRK